MQKIRILWSGITGRTGVQAEELSKSCEYAKIVAGICRNNQKYYNYNELDKIKENFDIIVDFSHKDCFNTILDYAIKMKKPLISGTSGVSDEQLLMLEKASNKIPIFRGGNFRFNIENFINDVVEYAKTHDEINLIETHYKTKKIPSETAKVIAKRVLEQTGKTVNISSFLEYDELINDWRVDNLHARVDTDGFKTLAKDVLKISAMMINKKANGLWDLDRLLKDENKKVD